MTMLDRYGSYDDGFESWGDDSHVIEEIYDGSLSQRVDSALNAPNPTNNQQRLVKLVDGMTPSQFEAATYDEKPLLVLAGAGTGQTRVLTVRLALLVTAGMAQPTALLPLPFPHTAAMEMAPHPPKLLDLQPPRL